MGWGAAFLDADLDGRSTLRRQRPHLPAGDEHPELKESYRQASQLFLNDETGFRRRRRRRFQVRKSSRGLAVGDLDDDGDLDVVMTAMDDVPTLLENRQRTGRHWVGFDLRKDGANRFAVGARVTVTAEGRRQVREVRSGSSYLSQSDRRAHFGIGACPGPVDVEVRLGSRRWEWKGVPADRYTTLTLR